jgi:asparagine synthase (glutamine-hydrolysing)
MCGIAGVVGPAASAPVSVERVGRMVRAMRHRGPDDDGVYDARSDQTVSEWGAVLGACRLAIQDLSPAGHQPMVDPTTGSVIVFNGEIYNFRELRKGLLRDGETLRSDSDTEVVLRLFLRLGAAALSLLEGMFALAIWQPVPGELFLARDRLGVKPLYVSEQSGHVIFASELRALLASECVPRVFSPEGADSFLRFGATREPHTIIEGVHELSPGAWLQRSNNRKAEGTFWSMERSSAWGGATGTVSSYRDAAARVRELIVDSVRLRLVSDVPVATFLSGGIDSSCIVAAVRDATNEAPATIGVTFKESAYTEVKYMRAVVNHFVCRHINYELGPDELLATVPDAVRAMDQPTFDGINTFVVSKVAAESGFKVALSGVGADELFGGYSSFRAVPLLVASRHVFRGAIGRQVGATLALSVSAGERRNKLRRWLGNQDLQGDAYDLVRELFSQGERKQLLAHASVSGSFEPGERVGPRSFGDVSRRELSDYMRNVLLRDTDCFGMACSLEIREPYLHRPLVELVLGLPDVWRARGARKGLLRAAMADLLPPVVVRRPKRGFLLPFRVWLQRGPLRAEVERTLLESDGDLLDATTVRRVWDAFQAGQTSWNRVWGLYVLRQWAAQNLAS